MEEEVQDEEVEKGYGASLVRSGIVAAPAAGIVYLFKWALFPKAKQMRVIAGSLAGGCAAGLYYRVTERNLRKGKDLSECFTIWDYGEVTLFTPGLIFLMMPLTSTIRTARRKEFSLSNVFGLSMWHLVFIYPFAAVVGLVAAPVLYLPTRAALSCTID